MLLEYLNKSQDKPRGQGKRYQLGYVIIFSLLAIICNAQGNSKIARFIDVHLERLEEIFGIYWVKSPHQDTIKNILSSIDATELDNVLIEYNQAIVKLTPKKNSNIIAIDGKTLRGSFDHMKDNKALQVLEVFATGVDLIVGHSEIDVKTNEIPATQEFIEKSGLKGCILQWMLCTVKKTLDVVKDTENEAIIQLKGNKKSLFNLATFISSNNKPLTSYVQPYAKGHGRIVSRKIEVFEISELSKSLDKKWNNIACIIKVERTRKVMNTKVKTYDKPIKTLHYYILTKIFTAKIAGG